MNLTALLNQLCALRKPDVNHGFEGLRESLSHTGFVCGQSDIQEWKPLCSNRLQPSQAFYHNSKVMCYLG